MAPGADGGPPPPRWRWRRGLLGRIGLGGRLVPLRGPLLWGLLAWRRRLLGLLGQRGRGWPVGLVLLPPLAPLRQLLLLDGPKFLFIGNFLEPYGASGDDVNRPGRFSEKGFSDDLPAMIIRIERHFCVSALEGMVEDRRE